MALKFATPDSANVPPPRLALLSEWPRAAWGLGRLIAEWKTLDGVPRGDGHPVILLPGLVNSDRSNFVMRRYLNRLGYRAEGWDLGRNLGVRAIGPEGERLMARIAALHEETGEKVTLIGISLGGIMARIAAHRHPELVREVITISSPFAGPPTCTNVWRQFEWLTGEKIDDPAVSARLKEAARPLPVPATAIWSRNDGLVNGLICREPEGSPGRAIEISSSHLFVQMRPEVLRAVAQTLGGQSGSEAR
ncbi:pimeloyl-ACP methyl ester carboxylesterase [Sphingomonas naasensis]|uniref:esterase/lipase family protein n=1 Tax=Sphingomonas naasensis TaxID=1344951 RepID=UPI001F0F63C8|nr:alpha/beta fold hydrolase [Sphingomonas naasensis]NIJ19910.1 pimeloyl-ACP methyl ester carboxylesterase [Sphingomonas naasensis]